MTAFSDDELRAMAAEVSFHDRTVRKLARELLEARRDVRRYRALRLQNSMCMPRVYPPIIEDPNGLMGYTTPEAIDAAIDAALAEGK